MKVDIEEAKYQAEKRREAIEKAKTLLYYQTDRVKQFHVSKWHPPPPPPPHTHTHTHTPTHTHTHLHTGSPAAVGGPQREGRSGGVQAEEGAGPQGQDAKYVEYQAAQREAAIRADLEAAQRRAQEKDTVARFQLDQ